MLVIEAPFAFATSSVMWTSSAISPGGINTATITVDCPAGATTWAGANIVTDPNGVASFFKIFGNSGGSDHFPVYPTDFLVSPGVFPTDTACGTYNGVASGTTDNGGTEIGSFNLSGSFQVTCATGVPQFPFGLAALFAAAAPIVLVLKKRASFSSTAA